MCRRHKISVANCELCIIRAVGTLYFGRLRKPYCVPMARQKQFLDSLSTDIMCLRHSLILFRTVMVSDQQGQTYNFR